MYVRYSLLTPPHVRSAKGQRKEEHVSSGLATTRPQRNVFLFPLSPSGPLHSDGIERLGERTDREGVLALLIPRRNQWLAEPAHVRSFFDFSPCTRASQQPTDHGQRRGEPLLFVTSCPRPSVPRSLSFHHPPCRREVSPGNSSSGSSQPEATQSEA